jgi:hypothetical protein
VFYKEKELKAMWTRTLFAFCFSCVLNLFLFAKSGNEKYFPKN